VQDCSEENWDKTIVNLKGVWLCMKYEIPEMIKQGKGVIVNCSSVAGLWVFWLTSLRSVKTWRYWLDKTSALNVPKGVRVNAVCPGVIQTPMIDRLTGKKIEQFTNLEPVGRFGQGRNC
jgi:NAD(P)-dependent dehydrogenase (short-subunit alcohol dehydrogenase family)